MIHKKEIGLPAIPLQPLPGGNSWQHLRAGLLECDPAVGVVELARPEKSNAFGAALWDEFPKAVESVASHAGVHALLVCGQGANFCAGLDLSLFLKVFTDAEHEAKACPARMRERLRLDILKMQAALSSLERCCWPVVAVVQGACVGAGVDLITAADLRYCSADAHFCVKEVDLAITADLGTLQRLPSIIGHGAATEASLTARRIPAAEALQLGLVSRVFETPVTLLAGAVRTASLLAAKPPMAIIGIKRTLLNTRDHPDVTRGLDYVAMHNAAMLISKDMAGLVQAVQPRAASRRSPAPASKL